MFVIKMVTRDLFYQKDDVEKGAYHLQRITSILWSVSRKESLVQLNSFVFLERSRPSIHIIVFNTLLETIVTDIVLARV